MISSPAALLAAITNATSNALNRKALKRLAEPPERREWPVKAAGRR